MKMEVKILREKMNYQKKINKNQFSALNKK